MGNEDFSLSANAFPPKALTNVLDMIPDAPSPDVSIVGATLKYPFQSVRTSEVLKAPCVNQDHTFHPGQKNIPELFLFCDLNLRFTVSAGPLRLTYSSFRPSYLRGFGFDHWSHNMERGIYQEGNRTYYYEEGNRIELTVESGQYVPINRLHGDIRLSKLGNDFIHDGGGLQTRYSLSSVAFNGMKFFPISSTKNSRLNVLTHEYSYSSLGFLQRLKVTDPVSLRNVVYQFTSLPEAGSKTSFTLVGVGQTNVSGKDKDALKPISVRRDRSKLIEISRDQDIHRFDVDGSQLKSWLIYVIGKVSGQNRTEAKLVAQTHFQHDANGLLAAFENGAGFGFSFSTPSNANYDYIKYVNSQSGLTYWLGHKTFNDGGHSYVQHVNDWHPHWGGFTYNRWSVFPFTISAAWTPADGWVFKSQSPDPNALDYSTSGGYSVQATTAGSKTTASLKKDDVVALSATTVETTGPWSKVVTDGQSGRRSFRVESGFRTSGNIFGIYSREQESLSNGQLVLSKEYEQIDFDAKAKTFSRYHEDSVNFSKSNLKGSLNLSLSSAASSSTTDASDQFGNVIKNEMVSNAPSTGSRSISQTLFKNSTPLISTENHFDLKGKTSSSRMVTTGPGKSPRFFSRKETLADDMRSFSWVGTRSVATNQNQRSGGFNLFEIQSSIQIIPLQAIGFENEGIPATSMIHPTGKDSFAANEVSSDYGTCNFVEEQNLLPPVAVSIPVPTRSVIPTASQGGGNGQCCVLQQFSTYPQKSLHNTGYCQQGKFDGYREWKANGCSNNQDICPGFAQNNCRVIQAPVSTPPSTGGGSSSTGGGSGSNSSLCCYDPSTLSCGNWVVSGACSTENARICAGTPQAQCRIQNTSGNGGGGTVPTTRTVDCCSGGANARATGSSTHQPLAICRSVYGSAAVAGKCPTVSSTPNVCLVIDSRNCSTAGKQSCFVGNTSGLPLCDSASSGICSSSYCRIR